MSFWNFFKRDEDSGLKLSSGDQSKAGLNGHGSLNGHQSKQANETNESASDKAKSEIPKEIFVEDRDPNEIMTNNVNYTPMDELYKYLERDFEEIGYQNALEIGDQGILEHRKKQLKHDLLRILDVSLHRGIELKMTLEREVERAEDLGLIDLKKDNSSKLKIVEIQIETLEKNKENVLKNDDSSYLTAIYEKYEIGFKQGILHRAREEEILLKGKR